MARRGKYRDVFYKNSLNYQRDNLPRYPSLRLELIILWQDYKQSGVIPCKVLDGQLQVMLITSSENRHWGFPIGVIEPGEAPQYSAEIEARDEGGLKGKIGIRLGSFEVPKWGANCTVETFAMKVEEVIPRAVWSERHRNRHLCNLILARGLVKSTAFIE